MDPPPLGPQAFTQSLTTKQKKDFTDGGNVFLISTSL